jgi:peptide chain release factor 1
MILQLARVERRFLEIESLLALPEVMADSTQFKKLSKERSDIEECAHLYREHKKLEKELEEASTLLAESSGEMRDLAYDEVQALKSRMSEIMQAARISLLPKNPNDTRNVFLEIRAGAGGDEAALFVASLYRSYVRYCERRRWRVELMSMNETGIGGLKEVIVLIQGDNVYKTLKFESGVHRVQRVPATEAQGRIHTSTITVAVLPEADDVEVSINDSDLRVDTYRAGGAGGQHVNRTDSAVRITHLPSGIVVACQDERSQIKNKSKALKILQSKLLEAAQTEKEKAFSDERRSQVGSGDRSERIRTYNFPQSRVTDHRIGYTTHAIHDFMDGDIQEMIELLANHYQSEALRLQSEAGGSI